MHGNHWLPQQNMSSSLEQWGVHPAEELMYQYNAAFKYSYC